jgi:GTPase SAR1 family protein
MTERYFTHQDLIELLDEFFEASDKENFNPTAGEFVDWIAVKFDEESKVAEKLLMPEKLPPISQMLANKEVNELLHDLLKIVMQQGSKTNDLIDYLKAKNL